MTLKPANNVQCIWEPGLPGLLGGKANVYLQIGKKKVYPDVRLTKAEFMQKKARSNSEPEYYCRFQGWNYWRFKDRWYLENDGLKSDEVEALIRADQLKLNKKINEAKAASAADRAPDGKLREFIPKDVRLVVWKRDGGVCRHCGAAINLEFDHIIPVSLGGADSADNLQVLCQTCNRQKGASI